MTSRPAALDELERVAKDCAAAEQSFRETYAQEIARLESERRRAFRRLNFLSALVAADAGAADGEASRAAQQAAAAEDLGWSEEEALNPEICAAFEPLADSVHDARLGAAQSPPADGEASSPDVLAALAAFELRFETLRGKPFAAQFDRDFPDTPLVDF